MKYFIGIIGFMLILAGFALFFREQSAGESDSSPPMASSAMPAVSVVATGLEIPWDFALLPDKRMLVTERTGRIVAIGTDGDKRTIPIEGVRQGGEGGLLGIVLHPQFALNKHVYLYMTAPGTNGQTINRVVRYTYENGTLVVDRQIIGNIPGAAYHDGGRIEFGPDGMLYITTGDATKPELAQNRDSLAGKILRLKDDGSIPTDNPYISNGSTGSPQAAVYSYGHRNPQGLAWDSDGNLWETEHGRSGVQSGLDELNRIEAGANYGWPTIEGDATRQGMTVPIRRSGARDTWAPASLAYLDGSLYWGGLRGEALYEAVLEDGNVIELKKHFKGQFGRIRTVRVGPDNMLYLTTSNRDGRGDPAMDDDKIIRVDPERL
jgi:aldose sugar dehydrogenase